MDFRAKVFIKHKDDVGPDPEAKTLADQLPKLGYDNIDNIQTGKLIVFLVEADDQAAAEEVTIAVCDDFLINPVYQEAEIEVVALADLLMQVLGRQL